MDEIEGECPLSVDVSKAYGRTLTGIELAKLKWNDALILSFTDGSRLSISDGQQDCCEKRYLSADGDTFEYYLGAKLLKVEVLSFGESGDDEVVEIAFLEVTTDKGSFKFSAHNEHNGYYGGFSMVSSFKEAES